MSFKHCEENAFRVSREILSIGTFELFFRGEIDSTLKEYSFSLAPDIVVVEERKSMDKFGNAAATCVIFFSEIKRNLLFAELFVVDKELSRYIDRPHFGSSQAFMFLIRNEKIHLISSKELIYS